MGLLIRPLQVGSIASFEKSKFTYHNHIGEKLDAPCISWLITGAAKKILVDTGPCDAELAEKYHGKLLSAKEDDIAYRLNQCGLKPEDIDVVILTHLHWDHCYHLELFAKAKILVQKAELCYAVAPLPMHQAAYEAGIKGLLPPWLGAFDRIIPVDGDYHLEPGLDLLLLPGHTPGLQGVRVQTASGNWLIASDFLPLYENWDAPGHIPSGIHVNLEDCYRTFAKIEQAADFILPGHDPKVFSREVYD